VVAAIAIEAAAERLAVGPGHCLTARQIQAPPSQALDLSASLTKGKICAPLMCSLSLEPRAVLPLVATNRPFSNPSAAIPGRDPFKRCREPDSRPRVR
jgi:hypothetical protein